MSSEVVCVNLVMGTVDSMVNSKAHESVKVGRKGRLWTRRMLQIECFLHLRRRDCCPQKYPFVEKFDCGHGITQSVSLSCGWKLCEIRFISSYRISGTHKSSASKRMARADSRPPEVELNERNNTLGLVGDVARHSRATQLQ